MLDLTAALEAAGRHQSGVGRQNPSSMADDAIRRFADSILEQVAREPTALVTALHDALSDTSRRLDRVSLAVTGLEWLGAGIPSVEQEMVVLVQEAKREIALCAYSVTMGAVSLLRDVREVVAQGVNATLIVNRFGEQPAGVQAFLRDAARAFPERLRLLDFSRAINGPELHAKVIVIDRSVALIGSANLSFHGMVSSHEMAVVIRGPTAEVISSRVDMLANGTSVSPVSL